MADRRRTSRFVVPDYAHGIFRLMQDVTVENVHDDLVVLLSDVALKAGEELILELPRAMGMRSLVYVHVVSCSPLGFGDARRYRAVLRSAQTLEPPSSPSRPEARYVTPQAALPAIGVLIRRIPVRVRDVSTSGCLLETSDPLNEGAVGQLEVALDGDVLREPLRVCRASRVAGSPWPWRAGGHFLGIEAPPPASVRNVVARFEIIDELAQVRVDHH
jgi:hypothetical protein